MFLLITFILITVILTLLFLTIRTDALTTLDPQSSLANNTVLDLRADVKGTQSKNESTNTSSSTAEDIQLQSASDSEVTVTTNQLNTGTEESVDLSSVKIQADSAIVWDVENQTVLYEKNADVEKPLASITKLMTALVAVNLPDYSHDKEILITRQHLDAYGNSGLVAGQIWNIKDLISFMLMSSANDASRAVASFGSDEVSDGYYSKSFIDQMNKKARELGLESTYFFNPSGLDLNESLISGGYGNARDIAHLFDYILKANQDILEPTTVSSRLFQSKEGVVQSSINTNGYLSHFSNILGSKTGYTVLAGGNLVMAFDLESPVVIVVLGSSRNGRFTDMEKLYNATRHHFQNWSINSLYNQ